MDIGHTHRYEFFGEPCVEFSITDSDHMFVDDVLSCNKVIVSAKLSDGRTIKFTDVNPADIIQEHKIPSVANIFIRGRSLTKSNTLKDLLKKVR